MASQSIEGGSTGAWREPLEAKGQKEKGQESLRNPGSTGFFLPSLLPLFLFLLRPAINGESQSRVTPPSGYMAGTGTESWAQSHHVAALQAPGFSQMKKVECHQSVAATL